MKWLSVGGRIIRQVLMNTNQLYIGGKWVDASSGQTLNVDNPATEEPVLAMACASIADVDKAIAAAMAAFPLWSQTPSAERKAILLAVADEMNYRIDDLVDAHVKCMGIPRHMAMDWQVAGPIDAMRYYAGLCSLVDEMQAIEGAMVVKEAIGVCSLINPWNYPLLQMVGKVAPALAAGCTVIAKPAEQTPLTDIIMAEIFEKVGLPHGVFNLVTGIGSEIGHRLSSHPDVDMVSFTGSTASGIKVAQAAAPGVKRVCQELGGKSPFIITGDADFSAAVRYGTENVILMGGQTCDALTRMFVPKSRYEEALKIARQVAEEQIIGDPLDPKTTIGPLASMVHRERVLRYIEKGIDEGARLVTGGTERPNGLLRGAYVKPTIFADVTPDMTIVREEIFGPVLCILAYDDLGEAIDQANNTEFGLSSAVWAKDKSQAMKIAKQMRAGQCYIQGGSYSLHAPFGGYKRSGNGREWGVAGLEEYLETKAIIG